MESHHPPLTRFSNTHTHTHKAQELKLMMKEEVMMMVKEELRTTKEEVMRTMKEELRTIMKEELELMTLRKETKHGLFIISASPT